MNNPFLPFGNISKVSDKLYNVYIVPRVDLESIYEKTKIILPSYAYLYLYVYM